MPLYSAPIAIDSMAQTWNSAGTVFTGIKLNVTNTASSSSSLLMDLQIGGVSKFSVDLFGQIVLGNGAGIRQLTGFDLNYTRGGLTINSISAIYWTNNSTSVTAPVDLILARDAANTAAFRNGTSAQALRLWNTYTDASNGEWGGIDWTATANTMRIRSTALGTGTTRIIAIDAFSKAGAAVAGDIPAGTWALVRDTSGSTTKLIYNNAGALQSVTLT